MCSEISAVQVKRFSFIVMGDKLIFLDHPNLIHLILELKPPKGLNLVQRITKFSLLDLIIIMKGDNLDLVTTANSTQHLIC